MKTSLRGKILLAGTLAAVAMLSACASTSDVNQLRSQLYYQEQERAKQQDRIAQLEAGLAQAQPAQANSWAEINTLRSEVAAMSGQMDDMRRTQSTQGGVTLDSLNAKTQELERRLMFMASQLGVTFDELPSATSMQPGASPAQSAPATTAASPTMVSPAEPTEEAEPAAAHQDLYQKALEQFYATNYKQAQSLWAEFVKGFPQDSLVPNAIFWQGECFFQMQDYANAVLTYQTVIEKHSKSSKYKAALLKQGIAFFKLKKDQAGKLVLQDLIKKYPDSAEAKRAQAYLKGGN